LADISSNKLTVGAKGTPASWFERVGEANCNGRQSIESGRAATRPRGGPTRGKAEAKMDPPEGRKDFANYTLGHTAVAPSIKKRPTQTTGWIRKWVGGGALCGKPRKEMVPRQGSDPISEKRSSEVVYRKKGKKTHRNLHTGARGLISGERPTDVWGEKAQKSIN